MLRCSAWPTSMPTSPSSGGSEDFARCFDMITAAAARLMRLDGYGLAVGSFADLLVLPCRSPVAAVTEPCQPQPRVQAGSQELYPPAEPAPHTLTAAARCGAGTPAQPRSRQPQKAAANLLGKVGEEQMHGRRGGGMAADVDANSHRVRPAPIPRQKSASPDRLADGQNWVGTDWWDPELSTVKPAFEYGESNCIAWDSRLRLVSG